MDRFAEVDRHLGHATVVRRLLEDTVSDDDVEVESEEEEEEEDENDEESARARWVLARRRQFPDSTKVPGRNCEGLAVP